MGRVQPRLVDHEGEPIAAQTQRLAGLLGALPGEQPRYAARVMVRRRKDAEAKITERGTGMMLAISYSFSVMNAHPLKRLCMRTKPYL